jgi:hypothetical protein
VSFPTISTILIPELSNETYILVGTGVGRKHVVCNINSRVVGCGNESLSGAIIQKKKKKKKKNKK